MVPCLGASLSYVTAIMKRSTKVPRAFLTGGTGFIGASAARHLQASGWSVVVLTRDAGRVPRDLHKRVKVVPGDLQNPASFTHEMRGCDVVLHCAKSDDSDPLTRAKIDLNGTKRLLDAAVTTDVRRFVYLSSIAAYGTTPDGVVDEGFPRIAPADLYGRTKLQLEQEVLWKASSIEVVVLQPANVYGQGQCWWGRGMLDLMRLGKVIMVNDGEGVANMVHVADVVQAIENALTTPGIGGESFLVSDGRPITWQQYYLALERLLGRNATISLPAAKASILSSELQNRSLPARTFRWLNRKMLGRPVIFPLSADAIETFCRKTVFSIAKARQRLGYKPHYDFPSGLKTITL
jgi:nucleoside-diphosphate-sugar epimerase